MEFFQMFDAAFWSIDSSKRTMVIAGNEWKTVYGGVPLYCNGQSRRVHDYEIKLMDGSSVIIGIDQGRTRCASAFHNTSTYHYGLNQNGLLFQKGTLLCCFRGSKPWLSLSVHRVQMVRSRKQGSNFKKAILSKCA